MHTRKTKTQTRRLHGIFNMLRLIYQTKNVDINIKFALYFMVLFFPNPSNNRIISFKQVSTLIKTSSSVKTEVFIIVKLPLSLFDEYIKLLLKIIEETEFCIK